MYKTRGRGCKIFGISNPKSAFIRFFTIILVVLMLVGGWAFFIYSPLVISGPETVSTEDNVTAQIKLLTQEVNRNLNTLQKKPNDQDALLKLANAQFDLGLNYKYYLLNEEEGNSWLKKAVDSFDKVLQLDPQNVEARVDMATAAFYAGENDLAKTQFELAIAEQPDNANAHFNYGVFLFQTASDYDQAIEEWKKVLGSEAADEMQKAAQQYIQQAEELKNMKE